MGGGSEAMRRGYDEAQIERAHKKRTLVASLFIFLCIPLTILAGIVFFDDRKYMIISTLLLVYTMVPFFMVFEKRKPRAREIVLLAMMTALVICVHGLCSRLLGIKAGSAMIIVAGISLGPEAGFFIGALARFVMNFFDGQGPWTPWQMFCWGLMGFLAGLAFNKASVEKLKSRDFKVIMGPVLCIAFSELLAYVLFLLFPGADTTFFGWRLYLFGALGLLLGVILQRKRLPVDDVTLTVFTFFVIFVVYGGIMNVCALVTSAGIEGGNDLSLASLKLLYISGVPYDFAHAAIAAVFNFVAGDKIIRKLERVKLKYGIYR